MDPQPVPIESKKQHWYAYPATYGCIIMILAPLSWFFLLLFSNLDVLIMWTGVCFGLVIVAVILEVITIANKKYDDFGFFKLLESLRYWDFY